MRLRLPALILVLALLCGCAQKGRVIPRADMVKIYTDMLLADAWLEDHPELKRSADTTAFYGAILEKYGYTTLDYDRSVYKYLRHPEKFAKIMNGVQEKLRLELNRLRKLKKKSDAAKTLNEMIFGYEPRDFELGDVPKDWPVDSTALAADTLAAGTLAADSLSVNADSLEKFIVQCDTLTNTDSLP